MKRQRRTIGAIVKIPLQDGSHSYGLVLDKASIAVFKIKTKEDLQASEILEKDVLFIIAVYDNVITSGRWEKIGKAASSERFLNLPMKFIQDQLNPSTIQLYNPNTGEITPSTKEECVGLERAAVWAAEHVEERISDFFYGRKNVWVEQQRLK
jgi:hypothetical protein